MTAQVVTTATHRAATYLKCPIGKSEPEEYILRLPFQIRPDRLKAGPRRHAPGLLGEQSRASHRMRYASRHGIRCAGYCVAWTPWFGDVESNHRVWPSRDIWLAQECGYRRAVQVSPAQPATAVESVPSPLPECNTGRGLQCSTQAYGTREAPSPPPHSWVRPV